jgi:hypothetical protein
MEVAFWKKTEEPEMLLIFIGARSKAGSFRKNYSVTTPFFLSEGYW